jgi:hypothetical protein
MSYRTAEELLGNLIEGSNITPDDLEEIVTNLHEGQHLDYKDGLLLSQGKLKEARRIIRQYVSGFANAAGGVLIIGVEDRTRAISPCKSPPGGSLGKWVEDLLRDMAPMLSPLPRIQVVKHPKGPVLVIATGRSPQLVFTFEAGRVAHYLRVHQSTVQIPEYLLTDLFLGRRQQPLISLEISPSLQHPRPSPIGRGGLRFYASLENTSLTNAVNIEIGLISWTLGVQSLSLSGYLRGYLDIKDPKDDDWKLLHSSFYQSGPSSGGVAGLPRLAPFGRNSRALVADGFVLPYTEGVELLAGAYVVAEDAAPQWWQCIFTLRRQVGGANGFEITPTEIRRVVGHRPVVGVRFGARRASSKK